MQKLTVQGFILIDVDAAALNNAGKTTGTNVENGVAVKKITKNGRSYPYVSGQAWRYWWRESLRVNHMWHLSPLTKIEKKNQVITEANPVQYPDDDVFGYVSATKDVKLDDEGNPIMKKGKPEMDNATVTRVSPLKNSVLISVASTRTEEHMSVASRHEGDPVLYTKEEYSAIMKGMFSLDVSQIGTFSNYNKTGFKNLSEARKQEALEIGATEIDDPTIRDSKSNAKKLIRLPLTTRIKRSTDTIAALKTITGGAMQAANMADVTPKFIILATMSSGNHPFTHIAIETRTSKFSHEASLNIEGLREVLVDYKDYIQGNVYIGKRSGFMDEYNDALSELSTALPNVSFTTVNDAIDKFCLQLEEQIENS